MSRKLKAAAVQMDASPAPVSDRLARAADLVAEAAGSGAQLVVLPEVFNTGYVYSDDNYALSETLEGQTVTWMKQQAADHKVYLAGTFFLRDSDEVYNTALLVAPDGQTWRYDKNYPFLWERAYFREGKGITVAETELGKLGMMICWDAGHPNLWERYAGKVDAMVIMSCPPKISSANLVLPDDTAQNGDSVRPLSQLSPVGQMVYTEEEFAFGVDMDEHAAWMGVPVIHTVGAGKFSSGMPLPSMSLIAMSSMQPGLWKHLDKADEVRIEAGYDKQTKVVDGTGNVVARVTVDGDGFTLAELDLPDERPLPIEPQPAMRTPSVAYLMADTLGALLMPPIYRRGLRRQWGANMAPVDTTTRVWTAALVVGLLMAFIFGRMSKMR